MFKWTRPEREFQAYKKRKPGKNTGERKGKLSIYSPSSQAGRGIR